MIGQGYLYGVYVRVCFVNYYMFFFGVLKKLKMLEDNGNELLID